MTGVFDATGWSSGLLGLFATFAAIGALRQPGIWRTMIEEIDKSPALQLVSGFMELFVGAAIYLVNPWSPGDVLSIFMKSIGGLMMIEALVVMGFSDLYLHFWLKNLAAMHKIWSGVTLVLGLALVVAGFSRFVV
jgi:hypothetical protein